MGLRDNAIVAYAETKVMEKSDRNVWVLSGEILEELLDKTGIDKDEIDGLVMAGLTGTGAANPFWAQTTADVLGLEVGFCEQVHTGGCSAAGCVARAAAAIDYGMCEVAFLLFADTHVLEDRTDHSHSYRREWTDPYGLMGPPGAFGLLSRAYEAKYGLDYRMLGKLAVTQRNHALHERERLREAARADHHRRLHELAHDRRSDPAAGLRDAGRRRGRPDHDEPQARQGKRPDQDHHPDRLCRADQLQGRREPGRCDQERSRDLRQEGARRGRPRHQGHRLVPPLRRLHHRHHAAVRGVRLLQAGRRRAVHPRPRFLLQRRSAAQHRRRPDFRRPGGVLVAQPGRGGAAIAGRRRQAPGQGHQRTRW